MRIVAAVGGRGLLGPNGAPSLSEERENVARVVDALRGLAGRGELIVTYGADLQLALLVGPAVAHYGSSYPLDALEAESEGLVGYLLEQGLQDALGDRQVVTMLTRVEVDTSDPEFLRPTVPVGPVFDEQTAGVLAAANGWLMVHDAGGRRRAVASPRPERVLESRAVGLLAGAGVVVVCCGGGGIAVGRDRSGGHVGVDAVVEKDLSAALLARDVGADALLLLTDAAGVWIDWGTPGAKLVRVASPAALARLPFAPGSMGAKVGAACRFVEWAGRDAFIGAVEDAAALLDGAAGTRVSRSAEGLTLEDPAVTAPTG